ncbi:MAG: ATP-binding protein [Desulfobacteraceae bacterium]
MSTINKSLRNSLITKILIGVGALLFLSLAWWGYYNIKYVEDKFMTHLTGTMDRLSNIVLLGMRHDMMLNSREDIKENIKNISSLHEIKNIRIYNKQGAIKFSSQPEEVDRITNIRDEACHICHHSEPPITSVPLAQRVRFGISEQGYRIMGIISPVYNAPECSTNCHVHPEDKKVLGALDLVVSLKEMDERVAGHKTNLVILAVALFCSSAVMIVYIIVRFVIKPVNQMIRGTRQIEQGNYNTTVRINQNDEMRELASAINQMGRAIGEKTEALNQQRDEYQQLFELVPCIITVQDRSYRLLGYNREFAEKFDPHMGDYCYQVYKGRDKKCEVCPVEKTFKDGQSHYSEESGIDKDGTAKHWIVRTAPIKDADGQIVAAMEMNLDITERKQLEDKLEQWDKKYHAIFNTIPNPVFVLSPDTLEVLDCNDSVAGVYDMQPEELIGTSFLDRFWDPPGELIINSLKSASLVERVKHRAKDDQLRYVTIRISPSEYEGRPVRLVTINDITKSLEAELQLIQASKLATLGEMATGVAHELNQPLSVIKTASNFFMRKLRKKEPIKEEIHLTMVEEIDSHVQRASKIINHMRQFGRKTDLSLEKVQINDVLEQAFEIFSQQLKVRGINVKWDIDKTLPSIMGCPDRLEQVMINLLINARDAIEEKWESVHEAEAVKEIRISTARKGSKVVIEVADTGSGIPDNIQDKLFEPFFTTKKVGQGTGLGLSISYGIIQECEGRIRAENHSGGACFIIEFPIPMDER